MPYEDPHSTKEKAGAPVGSGYRYVDVTPTDSADLTVAPRGFMALSSGTIKLTGMDGVACTFQIAAGVMLPLRATRVWSTGTTATGIVAVY